MTCKKCNKLSYRQKIYNYLSALIRRILTGGNDVPYDVEMMRKLICYGCKNFDKITTECSKCGCLIKKKALWASEECPIGYWKKWSKNEKN